MKKLGVAVMSALLVAGPVARAWAGGPPAGAGYGNRAVELVREIDDPASGARWLLWRDAAQPGRPGRLTLVSGTQTAGGAAEHATRPDAPVVRVGDRVLIEEHSPRVDVVLEGIALTPARAGERLRVRLTAGGLILRAVALGPGSARRMDAEEGSQ